MAETNERVMDMVRKELDKDPSIASEALYEKAKKVDKRVGDLSVRQFHARYPLQVKRAQANARKARAAGRGRAAAKRGATKRRVAKRGAAKRGTTKRATAKRGTAKRAGRPPAKAAKRGRPARSGGATKTAGPRKQASNGRRGRRGRRAAVGRTAGSGADAVRNLLLQFARDVAAAEGKADVVDVIGNVDGWVDRVIAAAR